MEMTLDVRRLVLVLVVVIAVALGLYGVKAYNDGLPPFGPNESEWTAVFLSNGQAYFGHFYSGPGEYATLTDVFYVLATQLEGQQAQDPQLSLQRRGGEIYGPESTMRISKQQILFIERLRADSPLLAAIQEFKRNPPTSAPAQTQQPVATPSATVPRTASPSPAR